MSDDVHVRPDDHPHVQLRDVEEADLDVFFEQEHDAEAVRRSRFAPRPRDRFMTHWATRILGDDTVFVRTVTVDGSPAGHIVAWWEDKEDKEDKEESEGAGEDGRRFIGYWLGRPYWAQGIGTKALALFLREERTRPLYADPFSQNTASVRLLERHGFRRAGTVRHGEDVHILLVLQEAIEEAPAPGGD
jgi:RimJ/RimL family protein N-acetyltransferase